MDEEPTTTEQAEKVARGLEPFAVIVFLTAGLVIVVAEILGIVVKRDRGDTVSDMVWYVRDRLPRWAKLPVLAAWIGFLAWLTFHFGWDDA